MQKHSEAEKGTRFPHFRLMIWWQAETCRRGIGARDHPMKGHGYNSAELQLFYGVLDRMVTEVTDRDLEIPVYVMI